MTTPALDVPESKPTSVARLLRDLVALTKPRITMLVLATTSCGLYIAPVRPSNGVALLALLGTALIVGGANTLNMYIERDIDGHMRRTKNRPLPSGRMSPRLALWFGVALTASAVPVLAIGVNAATALLALIANLSYVLAYTPMKQRSYLALWVGAVPGAMPPLLGWTAATGRVSAGGLVLFAILYAWQIPHFLAIALFRRRDYENAGLKVMPGSHGERATRWAIVNWLIIQLGVSLLLVPTGLVHRTYLVAAAVLGTLFLGYGLLGLRVRAGARWARSIFAISIPYLVLLVAAAILDAAV